MAILLLEPVNKRIAIAVSPKVACASLRFWLWELGYGAPWQGECIFKDFYRHTVQSNKPLPPQTKMIIAVHREGVSRLRAVYDHRIVREKEAPDLGIMHFARHLAEYCAHFPSIAHHLAAQSSYLGSVHEAYSDILPLNQLHRLPQMTEEALGHSVPALPVHHRTEQPSAMNDEVKHWFAHWSSHDTALGWDGKTFKIAGSMINPQDEGLERGSA